MSKEGSSERYPLVQPKFINPALVKQLRRGTATGVVREGAVEYAGDRLTIKGDEQPEKGAEVGIRGGHGSFYCKTVEQIEKEKRERKQRREERRREREREQARKQDRRRAEALRFWESYDIPFEYDVRIKVRRSGLLRGNSGTGRAKNTVEHLYVMEAFEEGRLSREADRYLCDDEAHIRDEDAGMSRSDSDGNPYQKRVTCKACLDLMERFERDQSEG